MKLDDAVALRKELIAVDAAALSDADKNLRVMDPALRPVAGDPKLRMVGPACTVRCREDFLTVLCGLREARAGEVLVVDTESSGAAVAGELFASEAKRRGLAGIVIDGGCRDVAQIAGIGLPVYARFSNPRSGTAREVLDLQVPVRCGGVRVAPGDWIYGDADGILVASADEFRAALPRAREIRALEAKVRGRIEAGESLVDLTNLDEHTALRRQGRESALAFKA